MMESLTKHVARSSPGELMPMSNSSGPEETIDLRQYWHTLRKRRTAVLLTTLAVFAAAVVGSYLMRPIYTAHVTLQIERENPNILSFKEVQVINTGQDDFYQTHHLLLQSRNLMRRVSEKLRLQQHPEFKLMLPDDARLREAIMIGELQRRVSVQPVRRSRLVGINVEANDPQLAADVANAVASSYIDMSLEAKFEATEAATEFLSRQIDALKGEIEQKKEELQEYAQKSRILSLDENQNITVQRLNDVNNKLTEAQSDRMEMESSHRQLLRSLGLPPDVRLDAEDPPLGDALQPWRVPEIANNSLITSLRTSHSQLQSRYVELSQRFQPGWPEMVRLRGHIDELSQQIRREEWRIVRGLISRSDQNHKAALSREMMLSAELDDQKQAVVEMNRSAILYNTIKAEVDTKLALLDSLLQRKSETDVTARLKGLKSSNVRIVDRAETPLGPTRPNKRMNALLGLLLGLGLGLGVAFFLEFIDNTIKSVEDVERYTGLPSFGVIPFFESPAQQRALDVGGVSADGPSAASGQLVTLTESRSAVSEAYRALRTSLLLSSAGSPPRTLLVTSSQPGEGKTTTVVNTAIALAQAGKQVLLIDADLRRPRCHKLLGLANKAGLSTYLSGPAQLKELVQVTPVPNLFVLTSGPVPPNPSELLGSERMTQLLKNIPPGIQHILLDSPPVLSVTDATLVATLVDGVMIVVRAGTTPRPLLKRTHRRIKDLNARIVGVILNSVDQRNADYYDAYSYSYTYGESPEAEAS